MARLALALRLALRDLRGGLSGFHIFLACIALGVAAIVGVGSVSRGLSDGLSREGRRIQGGDVSFALIHREMTPEERTFLSARGTISTVAVMRVMARKADGDSALIELKAVPSTYPSLGEVVLTPAMPIAAALETRNGTPGFVGEAALAARLNIKVGDKILIGDTSFDYRAELQSEPDKLSAGVGFGPRVIIAQEAFRSTGLLQPPRLARRITPMPGVHRIDGHEPAGDGTQRDQAFYSA
jgi:putative ABC transport system permease protein